MLQFRTIYVKHPPNMIFYEVATRASEKNCNKMRSIWEEEKEQNKKHMLYMNYMESLNHLIDTITKESIFRDKNRMILEEAIWN